jgi:hypothetical protein
MVTEDIIFGVVMYVFCAGIYLAVCAAYAQKNRRDSARLALLAPVWPIVTVAWFVFQLTRGVGQLVQAAELLPASKKPDYERISEIETTMWLEDRIAEKDLTIDALKLQIYSLEQNQKRKWRR